MQGRVVPVDSNLTLRAALPNELEQLFAIDADACALFREAGIQLELDASHPFFLDERARWQNAIAEGRVTVASSAGQLLGFMALGLVDDKPYLDQLAVRRASMRAGIGRALVGQALTWAAAAGELWLTTYSHLPWNRPYYERLGFSAARAEQIGPELREILHVQRRVLPAPHERLAMVRRETLVLQNTDTAR
jgi:GNAT superfamily N-acetyltransferase